MARGRRICSRVSAFFHEIPLSQGILAAIPRDIVGVWPIIGPGK